MAGDVVALAGPLGSGKTYLVKGIALGLGVGDPREVRSPTFVLISEYEGRLRLYHVDAYRLEGSRDFEALGSDELMFSGGVTLIEWADRVTDALPAGHLWIECAYAGETQRRYRLTGRGERHERVAKVLAAG